MVFTLHKLTEASPRFPNLSIGRGSEVSLQDYAAIRMAAEGHKPRVRQGIPLAM